MIAALQRFTGGQFDRLTQSHAVSALMRSLSGTSAEEYAEQLISSFETGTPVGDAGGALHAMEGAADGDADSAQRVLTGRRTWSIEQLSGARAAFCGLDVVHSAPLTRRMHQACAGARPLRPPSWREFCASSWCMASSSSPPMPR